MDLIFQFDQPLAENGASMSQAIHCRGHKSYIDIGSHEGYIFIEVHVSHDNVFYQELPLMYRWDATAGIDGGGAMIPARLRSNGLKFSFVADTEGWSYVKVSVRNAGPGGEIYVDNGTLTLAS